LLEDGEDVEQQRGTAADLSDEGVDCTVDTLLRDALHACDFADGAGTCAEEGEDFGEGVVGRGEVGEGGGVKRVCGFAVGEGAI
jgi:hypothetical protein